MSDTSHNYGRGKPGRIHPEFNQNMELFLTEGAEEQDLTNSNRSVRRIPQNGLSKCTKSTASGIWGSCFRGDVDRSVQVKVHGHRGQYSSARLC